MNLRSRNKVKADFNMSSMTDIIFLLLIFFMLTSTLVSPNVLKLFLPSSSSKTLAKQTLSVSINQDLEVFVDKTRVNWETLSENIRIASSGVEEPTLVLNADKNVPVEYVVKVMDVANSLKLKMVLATQPM